MKKNKRYFFEYFLNFTCIFMDTIQRALSLIPICIFTVTESVTRLLNDRGVLTRHPDLLLRTQYMFHDMITDLSWTVILYKYFPFRTIKQPLKCHINRVFPRLFLYTWTIFQCFLGHFSSFFSSCSDKISTFSHLLLDIL